MVKSFENVSPVKEDYFRSPEPKLKVEVQELYFNTPPKEAPVSAGGSEKVQTVIKIDP